MRFRPITLAVMIAMLASCAEKDGGAGETGTPEDEAAIRATNAAYGTQWTAMDSTGVWAAMADDFHQVNPDGSHMQDAAAVKAMTRTEWAMRPAGMTLSVNTSFVKFIDDDAAYTGGTYEVSGGGMPAPGKGSWLAVYRKDGDVWKVVSNLAAEFVPPPVAAAAPDTTKPN